MRKILVILSCSLLCSIVVMLAASGASHAALPRGDPFAVTWGEKALKVAPGQGFEVEIEIDVPKGFYLNDDKLDIDFVTLEGVHIDDIRFPEPQVRKGKKVHAKDVTIRIVGNVPIGLDPGERGLTARLSYQGCTDEQCFRPRQREIVFALDVARGAVHTEVRQREALRGLFETPDFSRILEHGLFWTILLVFVAGLITSLTPCVWPILPVTLVVIGVERQRSFLRNALLALSLVGGLVFIYAVLGTVATLIGRNLGFVFQQRWFVVLVVVFFAAMSLSLFGVFEVHVSKHWAHRLHRLGGEGFRGAFLSGLGLGLIASPCAGPVIVALLAYVALQGNYALGFLLLVVYGFGMGVIVLMLGAAYGTLANRLRGGPWMVWMKRALGVILLIPAAFYAGSLFDGGGISKKAAIERPTVSWIDNLDDGLRFAKVHGRPVMIDFYADWCLPCRRLDRTVFIRDDVVKMSQRLVPVRIDATRETAEIRSILDRYGVMGLPTFIFLSPDGKEYKALRVVVPRGALIERAMEEAIEHNE